MGDGDEAHGLVEDVTDSEDEGERGQDWRHAAPAARNSLRPGGGSDSDEEDDGSSSSEEEEKEDDEEDPAGSDPPASAAPSAAPTPAPAPAPGAAAPAAAATAAPPARPAGTSPAHFDHEAKKLVFFDVDCEVAGETAGLCQLSGVATAQDGTKLGEFDEYINPGPDARWNLNPAAMCHGLSPHDDRILNADPVTVVYPKMVKWMEQFTSPDRKGVLVAWNGPSCDMKWFFVLVDIKHADNQEMRYPNNTPYFWDPMQTCKYKRCKINAHLEEHGYALSEAWKATHPGAVDMPGAHNSLVDSKCQAEILRVEVDGSTIMELANTTKGIVLLEEVFKKKRLAHRKLLNESKRPVPAGWTEDKADGWQLPRGMNYAGGEGGPPAGPTTDAAKFSDLPELFAKFLPDAGDPAQTRHGRDVGLDLIAREANRYAKQWVREVRYGAQNKKMLVPCAADAHGAKRRGGENWQDFTAQSVKVYLAIQIAMAAMRTRSSDVLWSTEYSTRLPWIANAMTKTAFERHRRFIHFVDNTKLKPRSHAQYDKLGKIRKIIDHFARVFRENWTLGQRIAVDEAMIRYVGRAIGWAQYMPNKPIKQGIKVWCSCCAESGYLHSFEVYTGAEKGVDGSVVGIVSRLFENCDFESTGFGRILYTDNFYTSMPLMTELFTRYKMFLCGTVTVTKKKSRVVDDFPFAKLSKPALRMEKRGFRRRAVRTVRTPQADGPQTMEAEAVTWKDRKQVALYNNFGVRPFEDGDTVPRHVSGESERQPIPCPACVIAYNKYMGAVDRKDRDTADWGIDVRSVRWYLSIFYWLINSTLANMFCIHSQQPGFSEKYGVKHGRYKWQLDLAQALIADALGKEWGRTEAERGEKPKPWWSRKVEWYPCDCKGCFHCAAQMTTGLTSPQQQASGTKRRGSGARAPSTAKKPRSEHGTDFVMADHSQYCQVCRAHWAEQREPSWDGAHILRHCHNTKFGCATCQLRICKFCAPGFDHRTKTTSREDWPAKKPMPAKKSPKKRPKSSGGGGEPRKRSRSRG